MGITRLNSVYLLIHGELDRHVPVDLSVEYHRRAIEQDDKVRLVVLPNVEHFMIIDPSTSAWKSVTDLLETSKEVHVIELTGPGS